MKLWNEIQCMARFVFALLCRKCLWLGNLFDLWSLTEMKQTMQSTSCFFFISLSSEFCIERTRLALEELVTCSVCCPNRYICNKCVLSLHDNSWLQFIPLSWGICQTFESLADSFPWMMNHSGCPCPVQRQRCWHTCLFSEKSRFLWDTKCYYLSASFSLVTEMIQHPFDIRFGFKGQQILELHVLLPQAWKTDARMKPRSTSACVSWLLLAAQPCPDGPDQKVCANALT